MESYFWKNGKIIPEENAQIPFFTHALHYGSAVFEGIRAYNGQILQLDKHINRLLESARLMDIKTPFGFDELFAACNDVVKTNNLDNAYVRPLIWRGSDSLKVCCPDIGIEAAVIAWTTPTAITSKDNFLNRKPITLTISKWKRPPPDCVPFASKASGLYVVPTIASNQATYLGFDDALLLDYRGYIAEATSSNIFFVVDNEIFTPIPDCFLNGITRQTIIELSKKCNIKIFESHLTPDIITKADEVFLTGTSCEIMPIKSIDTKEYTQNDITKKIMSEFYDFVKKSSR